MNKNPWPGRSSRWAPQTLDQRIRNGVEMTESGCWEWRRSILPTGYGCIRVGGRSRTAHSVAYEVFMGPIPDGLELDHLCRNRACCNPDHLEAVTHQVNVLRGMSRAAKAAITHCPRGHLYDEANTYEYAGRRFCRRCQRIAGDAYRARKKAVAA